MGLLSYTSKYLLVGIILAKYWKLRIVTSLTVLKLDMYICLQSKTIFIVAYYPVIFQKWVSHCIQSVQNIEILWFVSLANKLLYKESFGHVRMPSVVNLFFIIYRCRFNQCKVFLKTICVTYSRKILHLFKS